MKTLQRVVWSLIFIVFGVYLVKAEVQEDQAHKGIAREVHPDHQDGIPWLRKWMTMSEEWCFKQKRKTAQERTPKPWKKTVREGTVRTQGPWQQPSQEGVWKHQFKGGELRRSGKKRSGKKEEEKGEEEKREAQKKPFGGQSAKNKSCASWCRKGKKM